MSKQIMKKKWRTAVVSRLRSAGKLTDKCKVTTIKLCGTVVTACSKQIPSGISFNQYQAMSTF